MTIDERVIRHKYIWKRCRKDKSIKGRYNVKALYQSGFVSSNDVTNTVNNTDVGFNFRKNLGVNA